MLVEGVIVTEGREFSYQDTEELKGTARVVSEYFAEIKANKNGLLVDFARPLVDTVGDKLRITRRTKDNSQAPVITLGKVTGY